MSDVAAQVISCGEAARAGARNLAAAPDESINVALHGMATLLTKEAGAVLAANAADLADGEATGLGRGLLDRLRLDEARIAEIARQISLLAASPFPPAQQDIRELPGGFFLAERRVPVGVIGANYEARPNVTVDVASQLLKSRNAGVLRTGAAALRSAAALFDHVIAPALAGAGHGDGGGVLYVDRAADPALVAEIITASLDRLGVCNRLNLLLVHDAAWDAMLGVAETAFAARGVTASLPPHDHPLGHEWALDAGHEATVTVAPVGGPQEAAHIANEQTSGLAASVVTTDEAAARAFLAAYAGTGAFWNASTRLLDGFKLRGVPETGINVDHVPGPRGPVTFTDLCLRQYVITPASN